MKIGSQILQYPMVPNVYFMEDATVLFNDPNEYTKNILKKSNYLNVIHLHIAFVVSVVSQFIFVPTIKHWEALT